MEGHIKQRPPYLSGPASQCKRLYWRSKRRSTAPPPRSLTERTFLSYPGRGPLPWRAVGGAGVPAHGEVRRTGSYSLRCTPSSGYTTLRCLYCCLSAQRPPNRGLVWEARVTGSRVVTCRLLGMGSQVTAHGELVEPCPPYQPNDNPDGGRGCLHCARATTA